MPERFTVEVFEQTVSFGPLRLQITSRNTIGNEVVGIMAGDGDVIIAMERDRASWRWQLASGAGQAFGYMNLR